MLSYETEKVFVDIENYFFNLKTYSNKITNIYRKVQNYRLASVVECLTFSIINSLNSLSYTQRHTLDLCVAGHYQIEARILDVKSALYKFDSQILILGW